MVDKNALREMGRKKIKHLPQVLRIAGEFIPSPWMVPTYMRRNDLDPMGGFAHYIYGFLTVVVGNVASTVLGFAEDSRYFLYPATMLSTNILSVLYEWYRYEKNKVSSPASLSSPPASPPSSVFPPASSGLESKVEKKEEQKRNERKIPRDIPNPWDIDIPKIEDKKVGRNYGR